MAIFTPNSIDQIASTILDGFDRHYSLFRKISAAAAERFDKNDWAAAERANRERIRMYDLRVGEAAEAAQVQLLRLA